MNFTHISRWGFKQQLILAFTLGIFCLALISSFTISTYSSDGLRQQALEQGLKVTESFAQQSALALLYESAENAKEAARLTLSFPDVISVTIFQVNHDVLFSAGAKTAPLQQGGAAVWPLKAQLGGETDQVWYFIAPVFSDEVTDSSPFSVQTAAPDLIGYTRLVMSKASLDRVLNQVFRVNLYISLLLASLLLLVLLAITTRVTKPLQQLAEAMKRAQRGEKKVRSAVDGPQDIMRMEEAFNTMMNVLEARESELQKARDIALKSARLKGEFATNVSHDLRTPLNGVLGMLELLGSMGLTPKQQEYIEVALGSGRALLSLIEDILDFSRIEAGRLKSNNEDFNLRDVQKDVVGLLAGQAQRKGLDIGYLIESNVPARLFGDAGRLRQILMNLLGNGIKFTERGEVSVLVSVVSHQERRYLLRFEVKDSGIGILEEAQERIFEPFSQADGSTTRRYGGTGLGLAICRQLVELLGGEIGVGSRLGRGSRFWFTLPMDAVEREEEGYSSTLAGEKVLVVDDSEVNRQFLQQTLERWGIQQHGVSCGHDALKALKVAAAIDKPYRVVMVDQEMPHMDGASLSQAIKADAKLSDTAVIMMIRRWQVGHETIQLVDAAGYIETPVEESALHDAIANVLRPPQRLLKPVKTAAKRSTVHFAKSVLVVEDNRANQQVALGMLQRLGCTVELANNGQQALEMLAERTFDALLMDCHMPELDGYEATLRIRAEEQDQHLPIIAMTANVGEAEVERCYAVGMDDYLSKPLNLQRLQQSLQRWFVNNNDSVSKQDPLFQQSSERQSVSLDHAFLDELRDNVGSSFFMLLTVFMEDMPIYLQALRNAISDQNMTEMANVAHSVKGSARNLGAQPMAKFAAALEELGRSEQLGNAEVLQRSLETEYHAVKLELESLSGVEVELVSVQEVGDPFSVVVVDDDRGIRLALRTVLAGDGYQVKEAGNGEQALALCERQMPDLVLMDALMPVMGGFEACRRIRRLPSGESLPIVIITALDDEHSIDNAFAAGATDFIPKPLHFAVLRQRVARLLSASRAEKHVHQLAYHDTLTGLPNRALFMEHIQTLLSDEQEKRRFAVLFLDLDRFKSVNDSLGHDVGDLLLQAVAERLLRCVRSGDVVARLGGDEFTIILDNIRELEAVAKVAEKICEVISEPFTFMEQPVYIGTSVGVAVYPEDGESSSDLLKHADTAMFRAKEKGGHFQFYEPGMGAEVSRRLKLEHDLRGALERQEFLLYYQPQRCLKSGRMESMEALLRWQHPTRGLISPAEFIPYLEESGMIVALGEWVLSKACQQARMWLDEGYRSIRMAVNLSAKQLDEVALLEIVNKHLQQNRLQPHVLELEITESAMMKEPENVINTLMALKKMGVQLTIDDFGTGYSSLSYLKRFPIDCLKIDRTFVKGIVTDRTDAEILRGIVALAHGLGLQVTAEGVESQQQEQFLEECGCDQIQGYFFSRPRPAAEIESQFLQRQSD